MMERQFTRVSAIHSNSNSLLKKQAKRAFSMIKYSQLTSLQAQSKFHMPLKHQWA